MSAFLVLLSLLACFPPRSSNPVPDVDVLVIGSGSSGLAAAVAAAQDGARVAVVDMADLPGGSGWYAGNFIAAGTRWQAELGITDSPEAALAEWASFTGGGDPADPIVQDFVATSADVLEWLAETTGVAPNAVVWEANSGSASRIHCVNGQRLTSGLLGRLGGDVHVRTRADALVVEDGTVVGAELTDLGSGDAFTVRAGAVVVATGGFARNLDLLLQDRPALQGLTVVPEAAYGVTGGGHDLLSAVGASPQNEGNYGFYVHSTVDPRAGFEGESLLMASLPVSVVVDLAGRRVANEDDLTYGLEGIGHLLDAPEGRLFALFDSGAFTGLSGSVPGYNWVLMGEPESISAADLVASGVARQYPDVHSLAMDWGIDEPGLGATMTRYNDLVRMGEDVDQGKPRDALMPIGQAGLTILELFAGAAKAFTGVSLDTEARVLDANGAPVPGLYAAGEAAGMLGTPAVGIGFSGSLTACHYTGRLAGGSAAAYATQTEGR